MLIISPDASYAEIIRLKVTNRSLRKDIESLYQRLGRNFYREVTVVKTEMANRWQGLMAAETERVKAKQRRLVAATCRFRNQEAALNAEKLEMNKTVPMLKGHMRSLINSQQSNQKSFLKVGPSSVGLGS